MSVLRTTLTCASPPTMCPVRTCAKRIRRVVIPVAFMRLPAITKNGTASSGNDCVELIIFWTATSKGMKGSTTKKTIPEIPIVNAIGIPARSNSVKTIPIASIARHQLPAGRSPESSTGAGASLRANIIRETIVRSISRQPTGTLSVASE